MNSLEQTVKERAAELGGKWVALVSEEYVPYEAGGSGEPLTGFMVLCGSPFTQAVYTTIEQGNGCHARWYLIISDAPFVVKTYDDLGIEDVGHINFGLIKAQQVSAGELGRFPNMPLPRFTRGAKHWRWVRFLDLAQFLRTTAAELWDEYYEIGRDVCNDSGMEVCLDGCGRDDQVVRVNAAREPFPYSQAEQYALERIWVPAGWVVGVCYLVQFGRLDQERRRRIAWTQSRTPSP